MRYLGIEVFTGKALCELTQRSTQLLPANFGQDLIASFCSHL
jgi:hypothetical protein